MMVAEVRTPPRPRSPATAGLTCPCRLRAATLPCAGGQDGISQFDTHSAWVLDRTGAAYTGGQVSIQPPST